MDFCYHLLLPLLLFLCISSAESQGLSVGYCNDDSNTTTPEISKNINAILSKLVQVTSEKGYSITSYGKHQDRVFGLAQCRGDVSSQNCSTCIQQAAKDVLTTCPDRVDAWVWSDYCFLRYNTVNFFGQVDKGNATYFYNVENVTDPKAFHKGLKALMHQIDAQAVMPGNKGLGKGESQLSKSEKLYALVQCTRDLSPLSCAQCLAMAGGNLSKICGKSQGCRVIYTSCFVRYELYHFFFPLD